MNFARYWPDATNYEIVRGPFHMPLPDFSMALTSVQIGLHRL